MNYLDRNEEKIMPVVMELNNLLADYHLYYQKLRNFHWNILGQNFYELHRQFEQLYNDARIKIDEIAERILTLRYHPISKFQDYLEIANLKETSPLKSDREMVNEILEDQQTILTQMRVIMDHASNAKDHGTEDLIGGYIREMEKVSWMLDAWKKSTHDQLDGSMIVNTK